MENKGSTKRHQFALEILVVFISFTFSYAFFTHFSSFIRLTGLHLTSFNQFYYKYNLDEILGIILSLNIHLLWCFLIIKKYNLKFRSKVGIARFIIGIVPALLIALLFLFAMDHNFFGTNGLLRYGFISYHYFQYLLVNITLYTIIYLISLFLIPKLIETYIKTEWLCLLVQVIASAVAVAFFENFLWLRPSLLNLLTSYIGGLFFAYTVSITKSHLIGVSLFYLSIISAGTHSGSNFIIEYFPAYLTVWILTIACILFLNLYRRKEAAQQPS